MYTVKSAAKVESTSIPRQISLVASIRLHSKNLIYSTKITPEIRAQEAVLTEKTRYCQGEENTVRHDLLRVEIL